MLVLQGKCTENHLLPSFDLDSFLLLSRYNGGMVCMNSYKINRLLSLESVSVYRNAVVLVNKLHKTVNALE